MESKFTGNVVFGFERFEGPVKREGDKVIVDELLMFCDEKYFLCFGKIS